MIALTTQSVSNIVDVTVQVSPIATAPTILNLGLIVGPSTHISDTTRVKLYNSTTDMTADGWTGTEPEFLAAQDYFDQSPPPKQVAIGRQDLTASPAETPLQAVTACRQANSQWYAVYVCDAAKADIEAIAPYIESVTPISAFFYDTQDSDVLNGVAGNVMETLQAAQYQRSIGQYSTTPYAGAALMGIAMGLTTGNANSAYTLAYKSENGITVEPLTPTQVSTILGYNGNIFVNYGNTYNLLVQGTCADGTHFDELVNLDILTTNIQTAVMKVLTSSTKVPQTDAGVSLLTNAITSPCNDALTSGVLAPGVWTGPDILSLSTGDTLTTGYAILADSVSNQSASDIAARKSPPIYVAVKLAGAIEHVVIGVIVNQ